MKALPPAQPFWTWRDALLFMGMAVPCFALSIALSEGLFRLLPVRSPAPRLMTMQFAGFGLWFLALYVMLRVRYGQPFWASLGWKAPWPGMLLTALLGPALALAAAAGGVLLRTPEIQSPIHLLMRDRWSALLIGVLAATLAPLFEELLFRGFLLPLLVRSFGAAAGVVLCSVPFTVLHGPQYHWTWQHMTLLLLASAAFCVISLKTGSTAAAALAHATYNLTFFVLYVLSGKVNAH
jgi:membrane protease YdiL (CAAX protease family)